MKAGVAARDGIPVLNFFFLVHRIEGHRIEEMWAARSVLTGHVAESKSEDGAIDNLSRAIDVAIEIAERHGHSAEQWYAAQQPAESEYLQEFISAVSRPRVQHRREQTPSGRVVIDAQVLGAA